MWLIKIGPRVPWRMKDQGEDNEENSWGRECHFDRGRGLQP